MFAALTATGLAAAAGLNAYLPYVLVAVVARFTDSLTLPHGFAWITSWWSIAAASMLLVAEIVLDKIAVVDHVNDLIATLIRPAVGGLIAAAAASAAQIDHSSWVRAHTWVPASAGVAVAGAVHLAKATLRPLVNVGTLGLGTPLVSGAEDGTSLGLSLAAVFAPLLVIVGLAVLAFGLWRLWRLARRVRRRRAPAGG